MDIYTRLQDDHNKHRTLMDRIADTSGDTKERHTLFTQLKEDVTAHANAEEQSLYAELIEKADGQEKARHSIHEHEQADELFGELEDKDMASPGWLVTFKQLKEELEHHMQEEEDEVFALAKSLIDDSTAVALAKKFDARKDQEKKAA